MKKTKFPHIVRLENLIYNDKNQLVEYDQVCTVCGKVTHVSPPEIDYCPGRSEA